MVDFDTDKMLKMAYDGADLKPYLPEMYRAIYEKRANAGEITGIVLATGDHELISSAVDNFYRFLKKPRTMEAMANFYLEAKKMGIQKEMIEHRFEILQEYAKRDLVRGNKEMGIWRLRVLWDKGIGINLDMLIGPLSKYIVNHQTPHQSRAYEVALNIFVDLKARDNDMMTIIALFNGIPNAYLRESAFRIVDVKMLEPVSERMITFITAWIGQTTQGSGMVVPDASIILLERMAGAGMHNEFCLDMFSKRKERIPDFDKKYPNLSYFVEAHRLGITVDNEFQKTFSGVSAMKEKRPLGPNGRPIKRVRMQRMVSGSM